MNLTIFAFLFVDENSLDQVEDMEREFRAKLEETGEDHPPARLFDVVPDKEFVWTLKEKYRPFDVKRPEDAKSSD